MHSLKHEMAARVVGLTYYFLPDFLIYVF